MVASSSGITSGKMISSDPAARSFSNAPLQGWPMSIVSTRQVAQVAAMRAAGFNDEEIWDVGAIAAFFALSNRMANFTDMRPNDEFYMLGRAPR